MDRRDDFQDILDQCYSEFEEIYRNNQEALVQAGYEKAKGTNSWNGRANQPSSGSSSTFNMKSASILPLKLSAWMITAIYTCYLHYLIFARQRSHFRCF